MKHYIENIMRAAQLPSDSYETFLSAHEKVSISLNAILQTLCTHLDNRCDGNTAEKQIDKIAEDVGINKYTLHALYCFYAAEPFHSKFMSVEGNTEEMFSDFLADYRAKVTYCKKTTGIWGINVPLAWFDMFFKMERYSFGRLQFESLYYPHFQKKYNSEQVEMWGGVINMHIPMLGPLTREKRIDAYKKAYDFYKKERNGDILTFACTSWLLYPENKQAMPSAANVLDFMDDFKIISSTPDVSFEDKVIIYGQNSNRPNELLPEETSMQREVKKWLIAGNHMGIGYGMFFYDGNHFFK